MKINRIQEGTGRIVIRRMAWNLNTQRRSIKHRDAPPLDCYAWEESGSWFVRNAATRYRRSEAEIVHEILASIIQRVESEPNRWWQVVIYGKSGYVIADGFVADNKIDTWHKPILLLGPYCKDQGVVPEFEKNDDGLYELPFNLPPGFFSEEFYDESKPDFGDEDIKPRLEIESIPVGTSIMMLDEWGLEVVTTEVV